MQVNSGSPAEAAGLKAGDAVIKVNTTDMYNLRHKDAQDVIVKAGNNFEMTVQRWDAKHNKVRDKRMTQYLKILLLRKLPTTATIFNRLCR